MKEPESAVFPAAAAHDVGVVIMNAGRNDRLFSASGEPPEDHFYRYVLEHPTVDVTIMGPRNTSASPASPLISPGYEADRRPEGGVGESRRRSAAGW